MTFAVFGKHVAGPVLTLIQTLVDKLLSVGGPVYFYEPFFRSLEGNITFSAEPLLFSVQGEIQGKADVLLSIGGDGTMLDAVTLVGDSGILLTGINIGKLGFLSSISRQKIISALDAILASEYILDQRTLLKLETSEGLFNPRNFALNEVAVYKAKPMSMLTIRTWVNGDFLNSYWADGLIVATPTGSTAYSLSCTGPIIAPDAESLVITPIASHNLTVRPVVLRDDVEILIRVGDEKSSFFVSMDSRITEVRNPLDLVIRKAGFRINLLRLKDALFFDTLRDKLNWGLDVRN